MKRAIIAGFFTVLLLAGMGYAGDAKWMNNFDKALKTAGEQHKYLLVNFSGSDWCRWCMKLADEVWQKEPFQEYAGKNLVLFAADFPRQKVQDPEVKAQNQELAQKYGVRGFPTVLLFNPDGKMVAQTGYRPGGAQAYVDHIKELIEKDKKPKAE